MFTISLSSFNLLIVCQVFGVVVEAGIVGRSFGTSGLGDTVASQAGRWEVSEVTIAKEIVEVHMRRTAKATADNILE
jgi:hypothetical protein